VSRRTPLPLLLLLLALLSGCGEALTCPEYTEEDYTPPPALGTYEMSAPIYTEDELATLPPETIVDATAVISDGQVVVEYTRNDGARFRATYASTVEFLNTR
jgi:hypothetical protein